MIKRLLICILTLSIFGCNSKAKTTTPQKTYDNINIVGAMKNVMWKGELHDRINLDTIANKKGLYGLGPATYLTGELLINNGTSYVSKVTSDTTMTVIKTYENSAPFFVYANVTDWENVPLSQSVKTISDIEDFVTAEAKHLKKPFAFKLTGKIAEATIHIQNLPEGSKVSSPKEAHQGQTNYKLKKENATIIGFFSTEHKGIFTHHDTNIHLHLITTDERKMGHLDDVTIDNMTLYLPKY